MEQEVRMAGNASPIKNIHKFAYDITVSRFSLFLSVLVVFVYSFDFYWVLVDFPIKLINIR